VLLGSCYRQWESSALANLSQLSGPNLRSDVRTCADVKLPSLSLIHLLYKTTMEKSRPHPPAPVMHLLLPDVLECQFFCGFRPTSRLDHALI